MEDILGEILQMAQRVITAIGHDNSKLHYSRKIMNFPLPVWAKVGLRFLCMPLVSLGSEIRRLMVPDSNELADLKLVLDESKRLEEVNTYYLQKLGETGLALSQYHSLLLFMENQNTPLQSTGYYKAFYEDNTAYGMERKIVDLIDVIRKLDNSHEDLMAFYTTLSLVHELRVAYASQYFIGVCGPPNSGKSTFINTFGFQDKRREEKTHSLKTIKSQPPNR